MDTVTTSEARTELSRTLARFRSDGERSEPLVFGDHRRPEGVVLPYAVYQKLETVLDQIRFEAAQDVMERVERVIDDSSTAVRVVRHRARSRA